MTERAELSEGDYADIERAAAKAMREWERGYVCQDINVRHSIDWWVMKETERVILERSAKFMGSGIGEIDGFQPIETAPKDGTPILARYEWQGSSRFMVIRRHKEHPWWMADHDSYIKHDDSKDTHRNFGFTHWTPLPSHPFTPEQITENLNNRHEAGERA